MSSLCESKIVEGAVETLLCPSIEGGKLGCKSNIREKDLVSLNLSKEILDKYTQFCVSKAIDKMTDFGWCPQCNAPAELD